MNDSLLEKTQFFVEHPVRNVCANLKLVVQNVLVPELIKCLPHINLSPAKFL